jgi:hypothetical protein
MTGTQQMTKFMRKRIVGVEGGTSVVYYGECRICIGAYFPAFTTITFIRNHYHHHVRLNLLSLFVKQLKGAVILVRHPIQMPIPLRLFRVWNIHRTNQAYSQATNSAVNKRFVQLGYSKRRETRAIQQFATNIL